MNRLVVLVSCLLIACSLEVPGSGSSETIDQIDPVEESTPDTLPPATAPASRGPGSAAPVVLADAGAQGGPTSSKSDAGVAVGTVTSTSADAGPIAPPPLPVPSPGTGTSVPAPAPAPASTAFTLTSPAFDDGAPLPADFTCDGADDSPPLAWSNPPAGTHSFSLVLTSKSASRPNEAARVEWVVWGIPGTRNTLPRAIAAGSQPSNVPGTRQDARSDSTSFGAVSGVPGSSGFSGSNGFGGGSFPGAGSFPSGTSRPQYQGPCGRSAVSYEFTLFALDAAASATWGSFVSIETVTLWIKTRSNVLAQASLSATYP